MGLFSIFSQRPIEDASDGTAELHRTHVTGSLKQAELAANHLYRKGHKIVDIIEDRPVPVRSGQLKKRR